jgi:peptidoglycan/LPS O-acetylase OafA/YrhL
MYLLFLGNFDQIIQQTLPIGIGLGVTWSVAVEEQFYLFWPLLFILFPGKKFIYPSIFLFVISIFLSSTLLLPAKHTLFCIFYLSTGAIAAYLHYYFKELSSKLTMIHGSIYFMLFVLCIVIMKFLKFIPIELYPFGYVIVSLLMGYNILYQIQCTDSMNLKNIPGLEYWGKYTYGLYLYHTICNFIVYYLAQRLNVYQILGSYQTDLVFRPILSFCFSLAISYYSYNYFEKFFLHLKEKFR